LSSAGARASLRVARERGTDLVGLARGVQRLVEPRQRERSRGSHRRHAIAQQAHQRRDRVGVAALAHHTRGGLAADRRVEQRHHRAGIDHCTGLAQRVEGRDPQHVGAIGQQLEQRRDRERIADAAQTRGRGRARRARR
jgi:hypothetical protein